MKKADLHVHSKFSNHPSEWFLQRIGANECYTEPEFIYQGAKERGMDYITITDHNRIEGSLLLKEKYPSEVFTGVETTTYFPEDGCKIHVLIYGLNESQFEDIQRLRTNIYDLREYLIFQNLAHSVAHATYPVNGRLTMDHLEKLLVMFNVFEGINGGRNRLNNQGWETILKNLSRSKVEELAAKHSIAPSGRKPWIKGITGGSDDHAGLFMGMTHTSADAKTPDEFLDCLKAGYCSAGGRHNDFQSLAFTVYKVAHDFSKSRSEGISKTFINRINDLIFDGGELSLLDKLQAKRLKSSSQKNGDGLTAALSALIDDLKDNTEKPVEHKLGIVYDRISAITDEFFRILLNSFEQDLMKGDLVNLIKNISASIPGVFLTLPFFSTLKHLYSSRGLIDELKSEFGVSQNKGPKRILWFTDTINDLNGVSVTLQVIGKAAHKRNLDLKIVCSLEPDEMSADLPPNIMNLPAMYNFQLPAYETYNMKVPSVLAAIKEIYQYDPDEIYISTPGPMGLMGLLAGKLMNARTVGVYHTDFKLQAADIIQDASIVEIIEAYNRWFYSTVDAVGVYNEEYEKILFERGIPRNKMVTMKKGIDSILFSPQFVTADNNHLPPEGINLLFAGRISKDKRLDFLLDVFDELSKRRDNLNLIFAGDGPYLDELKDKTRNNSRIHFTGRLHREELPPIYSGSDIFMFPSISDTFGLVVLESQACGLPAVVSDRGGPQHVIIDGETGLVAKSDDLKDWVEKTEILLDLMDSKPLEYAVLRNRARINAVENYDWNVVLDDIHGIEPAKSGSEIGYTDRMHKYCKDGRFSIRAE